MPYGPICNKKMRVIKNEVVGNEVNQLEEVNEGIHNNEQNDDWMDDLLSTMDQEQEQQDGSSESSF